MRLDESGKLLKINSVLPSFTLDNPMDIEFGEDGALYTLEYGTGYFVTLPEAQLARIDYVRGNRTPVVKAAADPKDSPTAPLTVKFSSAGTSDPDGDRLTYQWDFDADGTFDSTEANPTHTFDANGVYNATLKVTDRTGRSASAEVAGRRRQRAADDRVRPAGARPGVPLRRHRAGRGQGHRRPG